MNQKFKPLNQFESISILLPEKNIFIALSQQFLFEKREEQSFRKIILIRLNNVLQLKYLIKKNFVG